MNNNQTMDSCCEEKRMDGRTAAKIAPRLVVETSSHEDCPFPQWKRVLDLSCILCSLPLWLPLMIVITVAIKIASRGPIFFRQERIGYRGRRFMCLKFRSM